MDIDVFYFHKDLETTEQAISAEEYEGWRKLIAKSYEAIAQNSVPCIKVLEIRRLILKEVSTFNSQAFHDFLGTVERFELSLFGYDDDTRYSINVLDGYRDFVPRLDYFFLNHLKSTTHLSITAHWTGPLGLEGKPHARLALSAHQMPLLKSLDLTNIFVCPELVRFLVRHLDTLEKVSLRGCYCDTSRRYENGVRWDALLGSLLDAKPHKLRLFAITPSHETLDDHNRDCDHRLCFKCLDEYYNDIDQTFGRTSQEGLQRKKLGYATLHPEHGTMKFDRNLFIKSFALDSDQEAYDRLMRIVNGNASRLFLAFSYRFCSTER